MTGGPSNRCKVMCAAVGIARSTAHVATVDAIDTARLLGAQLARAHVLGLRTFREVGRRGQASCAGTWTRPMLEPPDPTRLPRSPVRRSRLGSVRHTPMRAYAEALMYVLSDGAVDAAEVARMVELRHQLELGEAEVRALHAQAFAAALLTGIADQQVQDHERAFLAGLAGALRALGWCPGD